MRAALLLTLCLALAGCAGAAGDDSGGYAGGGAESVERETELRIVLRPDGPGGPERTATLTCDEPGGTHPDPEAACTALAEHEDALAPVPRDTVCTQIYGGPDEAEVSGRLDGRAVEASFSKRNGCEIDRWDRLRPLLSLGRD